jgi:hypothetical protein
MEGMRNAYYVFVANPEGKKPLERPRCRWEDITVDLEEMGCFGINWIPMTQRSDQFCVFYFFFGNFV